LGSGLENVSFPKRKTNPAEPAILEENHNQGHLGQIFFEASLVGPTLSRAGAVEKMCSKEHYINRSRESIPVEVATVIDRSGKIALGE